MIPHSGNVLLFIGLNGFIILELGRRPDQNNPLKQGIECPPPVTLPGARRI